MPLTPTLSDAEARALLRAAGRTFGEPLHETVGLWLALPDGRALHLELELCGRTIGRKELRARHVVTWAAPGEAARVVAEDIPTEGPQGEAFRASADHFHARLGPDAEVGRGRWRGEASGGGTDPGVRWDLRWEAAPDVAELVPEGALAPCPEVAVAWAALAAPVTGALEVAGEAWPLDGAVVSVERRHGEDLDGAWLSLAGVRWDAGGLDGQGARLCAYLSGQAAGDRVGGVFAGRRGVLRARTTGERHGGARRRLRSTLDVRSDGGRVSATWRSGDKARRVRAELEVPDGAGAVLARTGPGGRLVHVWRVPGASARLVVDDPTSGEVLAEVTTAHGAGLEWGARSSQSGRGVDLR